MFKEAAILQKCFCDIPIHKLTEKLLITGVGEVYNSLSEDEKVEILNNITHPDFYGSFAIAFSKGWGEKKKLQPVHYLNEESRYTAEFSKLFNDILKSDEIIDEYSDDIINRLSFIKPIRGILNRKYDRNNIEKVDIEFLKNFHDEQEWRYVPSADVLKGKKMESVIANPNVLKFDISVINVNLMMEEYRSLWLEFNYDEIRYIIVPDSYSRTEIINTIMDIPSDKFENYDQELIQKYIMISKILVLDEIRKDW